VTVTSSTTAAEGVSLASAAARTWELDITPRMHRHEKATG